MLNSEIRVTKGKVRKNHRLELGRCTAKSPNRDQKPRRDYAEYSYVKYSVLHDALNLCVVDSKPYKALRANNIQSK